MSGRILIVEGVATNRISLRVKLAAAQYEVLQAASHDAALDLLRDQTPDLIIVDLGAEADTCATFCDKVHCLNETAHIPILVTALRPSARDTLTMLSAGADDVLRRPLDEGLLLARIRGLLRTRSAEGELILRDDTKRALGFAEPAQGFVKPSHVAMIAGEDKASWQTALTQCSNVTSSCISADHIFDPKSLAPSPDVFILDATGEAAINALRLLSELRSRDETRLAGLIVVTQLDRPDVGAMALDLGANDLIDTEATMGERALRVTTQIRRKAQNDRLRADLRNGLEAAVTDPLTGLFNRRYAMPHLAAMAERARENGRSFAVMVLDIDHFKAINDAHGHSAGDKVLIEVATRIRASLRAVDMVARIGGEEFLIALPDTSERSARVAAARICSAIHDSGFALGPGLGMADVTASIGLATTPTGDVGHAETIIERADTALYEAKRTGRDRVTVSPQAA